MASSAKTDLELHPETITNSSRLYSKILTPEHDVEIHLKDNDQKFVYKMDRGRRGIALIINNELFVNGMPERQGSKRDARCMEATFQQLGFDVNIYHNQTINSMQQLFYDLSVTDQSNNDCFACVILSHGDDDDVIFGTDGKITLEELISYLLPDKCPSLSGKPKLFFIQACRGSKMDMGEDVRDGTLSFHSKQTVKYPKIPIWADVLIAYSTVPGYYSWRNSANGSWFIQSLGHILKNDAKEKNLLEMLTKVNYQVAYEFESKTEFPKNDRMKQMPCISSTLTKQFFFYGKWSEYLD